MKLIFLIFIGIVLHIDVSHCFEEHSCTRHVNFQTKVLTQLEKVDLPSEWNWNNVGDTNYLTVVRNQHTPMYCGACWAFAATSSLSDRIKIKRNARWPDIQISPQVLLTCDLGNKGCDGGDPINAYEYIQKYNITDETCAIFRGRGHTNGFECSATAVCKDCNHTACYVPDDYPVYNIEEYGIVSGEEELKNEIYQRGPITCGIAVTPKFRSYKGGLFIDETGKMDITHEISVVGYGEDINDGITSKYWLIRNSWGTHWGVDGFAKVIRGINNLNIESRCTWAVAKNTWDHEVKHITTEAEKNDPKNEMTNDADKGYPSVQVVDKRFLAKDNLDLMVDLDVKNYLLSQLINGPCSPNDQVIKSELPSSYVKLENLPPSHDWRNIDGKNYCSVEKNQHIPHYCGSCWAHASTSALADRFNILNKLQNNKPSSQDVNLNIQAIVNCRNGVKDSCHGGSALRTYGYILEHGVSHETCLQYVSTDSFDQTCSGLNVCEDCKGPAPGLYENPKDNCSPVTEFTKYYVKEYGRVEGVGPMKQEILMRGPIACSIQVTAKAHEYKSGIFYEDVGTTNTNHVISVVGWGVENGIEYWIVRNSWGTYWGEHGYMKLEMNRNALNIEKHCYWAVPTYEKSN